jgi:hypothetical protein
MKISLPVIALVIASFAACASPRAIEPGRVLEVKSHVLEPHKVHEECAKLVAGDRVEYSWQAQAPLNFNIHYHEGKAVIMPLSRDNLLSDSGELKVFHPQDYCLTWETGRQKALLDYRVRLIRDGR